MSFRGRRGRGRDRNSVGDRDGHNGPYGRRKDKVRFPKNEVVMEQTRPQKQGRKAPIHRELMKHAVLSDPPSDDSSFHQEEPATSTITTGTAGTKTGTKIGTADIIKAEKAKRKHGKVKDQYSRKQRYVQRKLDKHLKRRMRTRLRQHRSAKNLDGVEEVKEEILETEVVNYISDINNPNWKTPGCRELRTIYHDDGESETLFFTPDKYHHKKVFVSFSIDDVEVDTYSETFRMKFNLQFNWIPSEAVYKSMYKAAALSVQEKKPEILQNWEPAWIPQIEFDNVYKIHFKDWIPHPANPEKGPFRLATYKNNWGHRHWGMNRDPSSLSVSDSDSSRLYEENEVETDINKIKWICAEMRCDIEFREELEIYNYPFDVQDLSCCFRMQKTVTVDHTVFALPNYFNPVPSSTVRDDTRMDLVGTIDPNSSPLDEWNVENCLMEHEFSKLVISLKLSRRWKPILINYTLIIFLITLLSFTVWCVDQEDAAGRLELSMTLLLTAVLYDTQSTPKPYLTYLDKYILVGYAYLTLVMFENAAMGFLAGTDCDADCLDDADRFCWYGLLVLFVGIQVAFGTYAVSVRYQERKKIFMGYEAVSEFNRKYIEQREVFRLYDSGMKMSGPPTNKYKRCLSISGADWPDGQ